MKLLMHKFWKRWINWTKHKSLMNLALIYWKLHLLKKGFDKWNKFVEIKNRDTYFNLKSLRYWRQRLLQRFFKIWKIKNLISKNRDSVSFRLASKHSNKKQLQKAYLKWRSMIFFIHENRLITYFEIWKQNSKDSKNQLMMHENHFWHTRKKKLLTSYWIIWCAFCHGQRNQRNKFKLHVKMRKKHLMRLMFSQWHTNYRRKQAIVSEFHRQKVMNMTFSTWKVDRNELLDRVQVFYQLKIKRRLWDKWIHFVVINHSININLKKMIQSLNLKTLRKYFEAWNDWLFEQLLDKILFQRAVNHHHNKLCQLYLAVWITHTNLSIANRSKLTKASENLKLLRKNHLFTAWKCYVNELLDVQQSNAFLTWYAHKTQMFRYYRHWREITKESHYNKTRERAAFEYKRSQLLSKGLQRWLSFGFLCIEDSMHRHTQSEVTVNTLKFNLMSKYARIWLLKTRKRRLNRSENRSGDVALPASYYIRREAAFERERNYIDDNDNDNVHVQRLHRKVVGSSILHHTLPVNTSIYTRKQPRYLSNVGI